MQRASRCFYTLLPKERSPEACVLYNTWGRFDKTGREVTHEEWLAWAELTSAALSPEEYDRVSDAFLSDPNHPDRVEARLWAEHAPKEELGASSWDLSEDERVERLEMLEAERLANKAARRAHTLEQIYGSGDIEMIDLTQDDD